jgi:hypothetical protein
MLGKNIFKVNILVRTENTGKFKEVYRDEEHA